MSWKDHIIDAELDILERFWENEEHGIREHFPDEPPASIYDIEATMGKEAAQSIYEAISAAAWDDMCDRADSARDRQKYEYGDG